uniref:protein-L-isoaspartate(D-aspartate) O-methyltransferase n=4 Tax=Lotharella globosa TaxID=91324 RepID=A0A7S3YGR9_9EUKA|mmetsp:Transcript_6016/g.10931  ORF Transcript_6016/g.10931 Transcript_6016/m.10931 type:complete len:159 (+) Transcript_6016:332-808(+)|eukprot:CAMPEP_0167795284 /NCGR_PEP_ID=MMETSP0111_2-20121227/14349_1 /TAXON_ID=91324 /ORGANISM="Lotharella globosa, Strain CCCM811" /LENGTH=158 /DNA_ID=CAMNT_0007688933 /DNA_START=309 /DNA_END=785 /DNA_ORIENTATION=-
MHAWCLELMELKSGNRVLDVGSGSGYLTACMAHIVGQEGHVYGVEHVPDLVKRSRSNIAIDRPDLKNWTIVEGDGRNGVSDYAPYDAIHVGAAASEVPRELLLQLHPDGGRLIIPVGKTEQALYMFVRNHENVQQHRITGVRYVPLTDLKSQLKITDQ